MTDNLQKQYMVLSGGGYLQRIDHMGSDERIIESARMSTGKGFLGWDLPCDKCKGTGAALAIHLADGSAPCKKCKGSGTYGDERLLKTLYTNGHTTPFEMCVVTFEVQAPIFVFREWMRHRTLSYNEFSARYAELPDMYYIPDGNRISVGAQSKTNKQGSGEPLTNTDNIRKTIETAYRISRIYYRDLLDRGVARELARLVIPVGQYSKMRVSGNLLNWIRFLRLRAHHTAQFEIREYAYCIQAELSDLFPRTMSLFHEEQNARTQREESAKIQ